MTTKIDELKALMADVPEHWHVEIWKRELVALIAAVEALEEIESHCYAGALEISEHHPVIAKARAALAPFGDDDDAKN